MLVNKDKSYALRSGERVKVYTVHGVDSMYPVVGQVLESDVFDVMQWTTTGKATFADCEDQRKFDLVEVDEENKLVRHNIRRSGLYLVQNSLEKVSVAEWDDIAGEWYMIGYSKESSVFHDDHLLVVSEAVLFEPSILDELMDWAHDEYEKQVQQRPDVNVYKEPLKTVWNQVIAKLDEIEAR